MPAVIVSEMPFTRKGALSAVSRRRQNFFCVCGLVQLAEREHEFRAGILGRYVDIADGLVQTIAHRPRQRVVPLMSQGVIAQFETIDVEATNGDQFPAPLSRYDCLAQTFLQKVPPGQSARCIRPRTQRHFFVQMLMFHGDARQVTHSLDGAADAVIKRGATSIKDRDYASILS